MQKTEKIWLDGKIVPWDEAQVHVLTHTLHYGWGAFEGIRCYKGKNGRSAIFRLAEHIDRLFDSAAILALKIPHSKEEIAAACARIVKVNKLAEGYIRPIVFVGDGEMGILIKKPRVRVAIACWPWGPYLGEDGLKSGIRAKVSSFTRPSIQSTLTRAKATGYYVNSVMAKIEVTEAGYDEAILLDGSGCVAECSGENIFLVKKGLLKTPPLTNALGGITRDTILEFASDMSLKTSEKAISRDELYTADEVFISGTAAEITPVREIDNRTIGSGKPGRITQQLQERYFEVIRGENPDYVHWLTFV